MPFNKIQYQDWIQHYQQHRYAYLQHLQIRPGTREQARKKEFRKSIFRVFAMVPFVTMASISAQKCCPKADIKHNNQHMTFRVCGGHDRERGGRFGVHIEQEQARTSSSAPNRFQKSPWDWKWGKKYTTINRIALSLTGGIGADAHQAFCAFKAAKTRGLCHVLALMVIFL